MTETVKTNHLANELSPYLRQHASNPVDWYPWCDAALEKAKKEGKPILLSIGYAACHWCHVMAHESFEDSETAEMMNKNFINIKVDREERPDLDKIYQTTHYLLTHRDGGWPLTVFLMPDDLTPFYSGTFFPLRSRYQLPAFKEVLSVIIDMFTNHQEELKQQNTELRKILHYETKIQENVKLSREPLSSAMEILQWNYDSANGGFGAAPKFFQPTKLAFLMLEKSPLVEFTLKKIAQGGINDQLDGGFFRYAVDAEWHIPHFEKMLYDNAQLIYLYAHAAKIYDDNAFATVAKQTADWVLERMQSPEGGYYASIDADSEDEEGKYYLWKKSEIKSVLSPAEYAFAKYYFGLGEPANFEQHWHLYVARSLDSVAEMLSIKKSEADKLLQSVKHKLREERNQRKEPLVDKEILTSWNALMIKSMLTVGHLTGENKYIESAQRAIDFVKQKLWKTQRLCACYKNGKAYVSGYLDDYAFLLDAILTAFPILADKKNNQKFADEIADTILNYFYDNEHGGFYFTAKDHEQLLYRPKTFVDEAIPSSNGVIAQAFLQLDHQERKNKYREAVEQTFKCVWPNLSQYPAEHCSLLIALKEYFDSKT